MFNVPYPIRIFAYSNTKPQVAVFNNSAINNMYSWISTQYGNRISKIVQNSKKGVKNKFDKKSKYLLMALYGLRRWYNGGFTITLSSGTLNMYWVDSLTNTNTNELLVSVILSGTYAEQATQLQAALPAGYTVTLSNTDQAYISTVNQQQPFIYYTLNGDNWSSLDYNPVSTYPVISNILQECIRICEEQVNNDIYTSIGLTPPASFPNASIYQNYQFFN